MTPPGFSELEAGLTETMLVDRQRLRRKLRELRDAQRAGKPFDQNLARWHSEFQRAREARQSRIESRPPIHYDGTLPIHDRRDDIAAAIRDHQVVVVCGETGSGKSTQLPKICLELGRGIDGMIGHTQPRRLAARSIASRVADELSVPLGREVGFQVRFADVTSSQTYIKLMTDGLLLAESTTDRWLNRYDTLIVDEAHERSLNIDFLLGYLHRLLHRRRDLKLIITSATIDAPRFAEHFADAVGDVPILTVSGRTFPVEIVWWPEGNQQGDAAPQGCPDDGKTENRRAAAAHLSPRRPGNASSPDDDDPWDDLINAIDYVCRRGPGDILVFLPTERDIHEAMKLLRGRALPGGKPDLLPLYARLSAAEQQRVFSTGSARRIVLATNVAESSLTVPGIRYVVDTGTARISRYSPKSKLQRLPIEPVSQASVDQRSGRCGRVGPGVCVRLFSQQDYDRRERYSPPEILRSNLAAVILQLEALGLGHVDQFPFLDPPKQEAVRDAYKTLIEIGAVDDRVEGLERKVGNRPRRQADERPESPTGINSQPLNPTAPRYHLTPLGRALHRMPVDPRIARIVVAAEHEHCVEDILIIASALEILDPRERPLERQQDADAAHSRFRDPESDFLSYLRLWDFYHKLKDDLTRSQLRKACQQNFLSFVRMKEWEDIHRELRDVVRDGRANSGTGRHPEPGKSGRRSLAVNGNRGADVVASDVDRSPNVRDVSETSTRAQSFSPSSSRAPLAEGPCDPSRSAAIHRALLTGFLSNIAYRTEAGDYLVAGGTKAVLWPGSSLSGKSPKWIVCGELVETTRRYLRTMGRIDPAWIEPLAAHLVSRTYSEPHWDPDVKAVMAFERVSLFGLPVVPRRRVRYARIDADACRGLFLREGLVLGLWPEPPEFLAHNLALATELRDLQTRARQPAALRDEEELITWYDARLPRDIVDGPTLMRWLRIGDSGSGELRNPVKVEDVAHPLDSGEPPADKSLWSRTSPSGVAFSGHLTSLLMTTADLLVPDADVTSPALFPPELCVRQLQLPLTYKHEPGEADDGVTVVVPQEGLNQLDADRLGWLVPGLLEEKVTALLRSLPKDLRRELVPLPEVAKQVTAALRFGEGPLLAAICRALEQICGIGVPPSAFQEDRLPEFLKLRVSVVDAAGNALAVSRDLGELRAQLGAKATATFAATPDPQWTRDGLKTWDFGPLPEAVSVKRNGLQLTGFPTLLDRGDSIALRLLDSAVQAVYEYRFGLTRLFCLAMPRELKQQVDHIPYLNAWTLLGQTLPQPFALRQHLAERIAERAFLAQSPWPRSQADFGLRVAEGKPQIPAAAADVARQLQPLFEAYSQVRKLWERTHHPQFQETRQDAHDHLSTLLSPGFLIRTPWTWFVHFPRYLRGIARRLEKLTAGAGPRDAQLLPGLRLRWQRWKDRHLVSQDRGVYEPELENYRWMLEEYRILLFAQDLGTSISVSEKRLDKQWALVTEG